MTRNSHHPHTATHARLVVRLTMTAFVIIGAALASCSTTEGFGKDVKDLGGGIEDSAARNK